MLDRMRSLARLITPRQKANPAGEGNYHPGPYTVSGGILPASWGQYLNFWQMDRDPLAVPSNSIVEACIWCYIRAIAQLPGYHRRELGNGGTENVTTSAVSRLLRSPNEYQTPSDFLTHLIRSLLLAGNSYWIAQRNDRQEVSALHWTDPRACRVREVRVPGQVFAEVFYEIGENPLIGEQQFGRNLVVPARDVLHIKLATPRHPLIGETWLSALAGQIAQQGAIEHSLTSQIANMRPTGVIEAPPEITLTKAQIDELRALWNQQAATITSGGVPILQKGLKFHPISMSAEDQQIIEQQKLNDRAIAAVFGVPAMLLGISDAGTQKSAEALMAEWLASGLGWLINHVEVSIDKFIGLDHVAAGREWTEFDTRALLRSAFKDRIDGLVRGVQGGIYAPNEARALEGYGSVADGDEPRVQQQVVPLSFAMEPPAPPAPPLSAPQAASADGVDEEDTLDDDERAAIALLHLRRELDHVRAAA